MTLPFDDEAPLAVDAHPVGADLIVASTPPPPLGPWGGLASRVLGWLREAWECVTVFFREF